MEFPSRDRLTLGLFVFGLVSVSVRAQEFRARVQGAVMDSTQAVVVGATVSLSNLKTGVQAVRVTNETGRYRFDFVGPGSYTIKVEAPGFSRFSQENIVAQALADITVDPGLKPGEVPFKLDLLNPAVQDTRRNEMMPYQEKYGKGSSLHLVRFERFPSARTLKNGASQTRRLGPYVLIPVLGAQA